MIQPIELTRSEDRAWAAIRASVRAVVPRARVELADVARLLGVDVAELRPAIEGLVAHGLLEGEGAWVRFTARAPMLKVRLSALEAEAARQERRDALAAARAARDEARAEEMSRRLQARRRVGQQRRTARRQQAAAEAAERLEREDPLVVLRGEQLDNLRMVRERRKLSRIALGLLLSVSATTIFLVELGNRPVRRSLLERWRSVLASTSGRRAA